MLPEYEIVRQRRAGAANRGCSMGLGDVVEKALATAGITPARVERWLGRECGGCKRRQDKLNQLGYWALAVLRGKAGRRELEADMEEN